MTAPPSTEDILRSLWLGAGLPASHLDSANVSLPNASLHVLPSSFRIGQAAQATIAASGLAASLYRSLTEGGAVEVQVDARHAALEFASEQYSRLHGPGKSKSDAVHVSHDRFKEMLGIPSDMPTQWDPLAGYYQCAHDRFIRLHTNWEHHKNGLLKILGLNSLASREEVANILIEWEAEDFETVAREAGMCATMCRTSKEWKGTEMAKSVQAALDENHGCPVKVIRVASSKPATLSTTRNYLRVIDMSRVLAAPIAARTLAKHGADVLLLSSLRLPNLPLFVIDTGRGKRSADLDLDTSQGVAKLTELIKDADIMLQAYRPGALAERGFGIDDVQRIRPGLIYAELSAYGSTGPWKHVRGFDSLVQSASGINDMEAESYQDYQHLDGTSSEKTIPLSPRVLPCQALDHASGYLLAFGILAAKCRSLLEAGEEDKGSGWHVQVSLTGVATWLESLGRVHGKEAWQLPSPIEPLGKEVLELLEPYTVRGAVEPLTLYAMRHSVCNMPASSKHKQSVPAHLDVDEAEWE